ncbi:MAG: hypothetical protein O2960_30185 [Verrucomicrobia bacterium]|nr:hypothetical protein [Verrucomicrobiota bacterium]
MNVPRLWFHAVPAALASTLIGCAAFTKTTFSEYRGPSEFQGQGGTVRKVDDIDVWETGAPNRKYRVLGIIQQSHYDNHSLVSVIAGASKDSAIVKEAKKQGGDAIIVLGSSSAITGYSTAGSIHGSQTGSLSGYGSGSSYSGTYRGSLSAQTRANTQTEKSIAVIKYLD